jgi:hypothetical protein
LLILATTVYSDTNASVEIIERESAVDVNVVLALVTATDPDPGILIFTIYT